MVLVHTGQIFRRRNIFGRLLLPDLVAVPRFTAFSFLTTQVYTGTIFRAMVGPLLLSDFVCVPRFTAFSFRTPVCARRLLVTAAFVRADCWLSNQLSITAIPTPHCPVISTGRERVVPLVVVRDYKRER